LDHSNTGIPSSNPSVDTSGFFCVMWPCACRDLEMGRSSVKGVQSDV